MRYPTKQSKNETGEIISCPHIQRPLWHLITINSFLFFSCLFVICYVNSTYHVCLYYAVETCLVVFVILLQLLSRCMPEAKLFTLITGKWVCFNRCFILLPSYCFSLIDFMVFCLILGSAAYIFEKSLSIYIILTIMYIKYFRLKMQNLIQLQWKMRE